MKRPDYEQLTLFPVDSPASRSLLPGSDEARTTTVISGQRCYELSESCGLLGCLEKMLLASQIWHSTLCFLTWKTKATKQGRLWFQLAVSVPRTEDTGSPSSDAEMWTTPCAADARGTSGGGNCRSLRTDLKGQPNPDWVEWLMGYERRFTQMMPTVTASDSRGAMIGRFAGGGHYRGNLSELLELTPMGLAGRMNPEWTEWFMGYPIGWTELNASETR